MTQPPRLTYRRLVLELDHGAADPDMIRLAAEIAHGLDLDLHGLFVEDEALHDLAALPFARQILLPTHQWQPVDPDRMATELRQAAEVARRRLQQIVAAQGVRVAFEVVRGDPHVCVAGVCFPTDIVVVHAAPSEAQRRMAEAMRTSVLLMPPRRVPHPRGPVVAIARDPADPCLAVAERIAGDGALVVLIPDAAVEPPPATRRTQVRHVPDVGVDDVLHALSHMRERLIVVTHSASGSIGLQEASRLVAMRHVPVLILQA